MAKKEKAKKSEAKSDAEDLKPEKSDDIEEVETGENIVEEEKEEEAASKEQDYNSIFDDDYNPNSDEGPEGKEEDDEGEAEEQEKEGAEVPAESVGEETDDAQEAIEEETQAREKSKEPSPKKSSNDKKKDESKKDKSEDNKEKAKKNDDEIVLDNHKDKSGKGKGTLAKKILIALVVILALLAGAFGGYLYFKSTNKPKEEPAPAKIEEPKEEETKKEVYVTADGGLNLRENPDSSSKSLVLIPNGTKLTVLEEKDGWYKVEYDGKQGWVSKDFVSEQKPDDMKTYTGTGFSPEGLKFSIKYPSDWTLNDYKVSKTDNGKKYTIALGEGGHGLNEGGDTGITTSSEDVTYNGLPATKIVAKNQGNIFLIVGQFKKGDASVQIEFSLPEGYDQSYIDTFDKMLNTFKFL